MQHHTRLLNIPVYAVPVITVVTSSLVLHEPISWRSSRERLYEPVFSDLTVVDFSDVAQGCRTYDEFIEKAVKTGKSALTYLGVGICGNEKLINKLTGFLPLLR